MLKKKTNFINDILALSIIFEKDFITFYSKPSFIKNQYFISIFNVNILKSLKFLYEYKPITMIDITCIDNFQNINLSEVILNKPSITGLYTFLSYSKKTYLHFFFSNFFYIDSINTIFNNSSWLEREQYEFFGVFYNNNNDLRNLLLEYNFNNNVFLKNYDIVNNNNIIIKYYDYLIKSDVTYSNI